MRSRGKDERERHSASTVDAVFGASFVASEVASEVDFVVRRYAMTVCFIPGVVVPFTSSAAIAQPS